MPQALPCINFLSMCVHDVTLAAVFAQVVQDNSGLLVLRVVEGAVPWICAAQPLAMLRDKPMVSNGTKYLEQKC